MFKEHSNAIWGGCCSCGKECYVLQNKFHPWMETDFKAVFECPVCGRKVEVDQSKASDFYSRRILSYYENLQGNVVDMGCGGGFLSEFLADKPGVKKIYAIDCDASGKEAIEQIQAEEGKLQFIHMDIAEMSERFEGVEIDYAVSRDVFMFIENTEQYFNDITKIVKKGIRQMGWYVTDSERMKNKLLPDQIAEELEKRGWKVQLEYLDWYKCGYFIKADK